MLLRAETRIANDHAEALAQSVGMILVVTEQTKTYWLEGLDLGCLLVVGKTILHIVDGHTAVTALKTKIGFLWNTLVGSVSGAEVKDGSPVVGEIRGKLASCARSLVGKPVKRRHRGIEHVLRILASTLKTRVRD